MITLITGSPGTGKTAAVVAMLSETAPDRPIYVNGIPDLRLPGRQTLPLDDVATWDSEVPDGALVVIDEVQRVWRPRPAGQTVPPDIAALETHRHRGLDFIIITQHPGLIHKNVRTLVGRHVHLRDVGLLGRYWYEWPECCENALSGWKTAPIKRRYRLPTRVFGLYRSASIHTKRSRSVPVPLIVAALALVAFVALGWRVYGQFTRSDPAPAPVSAPALVDDRTSIDQQRDVSQATRIESEPERLRLIDDRVDWFPRVSTRPESAPAYDHLRQVRAMPVVAGGACMGGTCRCYTQQATDAGLSSDECRRWIDQPPFNAYAEAGIWPDPPPLAPPAVEQPETPPPPEPMGIPRPGSQTAPQPAPG